MFEVDCNWLHRRVYDDDEVTSPNADEVAAEVEDFGTERLNNCKFCSSI
tara:strand:- start:1061 stop:1207 length:147 start_codon:yes stop_codon:yes gene_type:complete